MAKSIPLTYRQRQAQGTQQLIVDAARELFLEQGYGATTLEAVSARAGVAVSTVYAVFKNKRGILKSIRESWHLDSGQRDIYQQALQVADARRRLAMFAQATRRQWETGAAMLAIYTSAAAVDADAAAELKQAQDGRRQNVGRVIRASYPLLRQNIKEAHAIAVYLALTRPEVYQELVDSAGWTPDAYEAWLTEALQQQLLPER